MSSTLHEANATTVHPPEHSFRLVFVGVAPQLARAIEELVGEECFEVAEIQPGEVKRFSSALSGKKSANRVIVGSPEIEEELRQQELVRLCGGVRLALSPARLVVMIPRLDMELVGALMRRGVDGVVLAGSTASEILEEVLRERAETGELVPDTSLALDSLRRVAEELHLSEDPLGKLKRLLARFAGELNVDRASITLVDGEKMKMAAVVGPMPGIQEGDQFNYEKNSITGWVVDHRSSRLIRGDMQRDGRASGRVQSAICAPLIARDELLGVVNFSCLTGGRTLDHNDLVTAELFSSLLSLSISNQRLHERSLQAERLSAIGSTISVISHCLKNLLQVLGGSISLMDRAFESQDLGMAATSFGMLKSGVRRIENLVLDLLDVTKEREPELNTVDLDQLAERIRQSFHNWANVQQRELTVDVAGMRAVMLDEYRLERALLNLLSNAIDATRPTGRIALHAWQENNEVCFQVADDGPGVSPEKLDSIFEIFYSTKGSKGTGLGLAMVSKFCKENGGKAEADRSDDLGGLAVTLKLPLVDAAEAKSN